MRKLLMSLMMAGSLLTVGIGAALADDASAPAAASGQIVIRELLTQRRALRTRRIITNERGVDRLETSQRR